jgi:hypothetical protein
MEEVIPMTKTSSHHTTNKTPSERDHRIIEAANVVTEDTEDSEEVGEGPQRQKEES